MPFKRSLMAAGVLAGQADAILGVDEFGKVAASVVAASPTEAQVKAAPAVIGVTCRVTAAAASSAVRWLPVQDVGDTVRVLNASSYSIRVFPPQVATGGVKHQLKALAAATGGVTVNAGDSADLMYCGKFGEGASAVHRWFQVV